MGCLPDGISSLWLAGGPMAELMAFPLRTAYYKLVTVDYLLPTHHSHNSFLSLLTLVRRSLDEGGSLTVSLLFSFIRQTNFLSHNPALSGQTKFTLRT